MKLFFVLAALMVTTGVASAGVEVRSTTITIDQFNSNCAAMEGSADNAVGGRRCTLPSGTQVTCAFGNSTTTDCLAETREKGKGKGKDQQDYLVVEMKDLLVTSYRSGDSDVGGVAPAGSLSGSTEVADPGSGGGGKPASVDGSAAGGNPDSMGGGGGPSID